MQKKQQPDVTLRRIERALHELRGGYPVLLTREGKAWLVVSAEYYLDADASPLFVFPQGVARLVFSGLRAKRLGLQSGEGAVSVPFALAQDILPFIIDPQVSVADKRAPLAGERLIEFQTNLADATAEESAVLELVKLAELLPSAVVAEMELGDIPAWLAENHILQVEAEDIAHYRSALVATLRQVSIAQVPLAGAEQVRVAAYRPRYGAVEHLAVIVGEPEKAAAPLVRVHSSCVTGDILGSLRCDCGEQLHEAIARMAAEGAGVLLYMSQEGRGIGIANKLRAYVLQDAGMDTLDANEALGFAADERQFAAAGHILKHLRLNRVRLMSNNPLKVEALQQQGVEVEGRVALRVAANPHNARYLSTKDERFGHLS